jgi:hypothetical protein
MYERDIQMTWVVISLTRETALSTVAGTIRLVLQNGDRINTKLLKLSEWHFTFGFVLWRIFLSN